MSAARRWIPRFATGHAEQVLDIAQEYGFASEPTIGSFEEFDVVDAIGETDEDAKILCLPPGAERLRVIIGLRYPGIR